MTFGSIKATAPAGSHIGQLGRPFDREFNEIPAGTLFPDAPEPLKVAATGFKHEVVTVDTEEQLSANARGWGFIQVSAEVVAEKRFAAYRAYQLSHVVTLDDSTNMREPPPQARYYAWKLYYGRSYEAVMEGTTRDFNAGVRASLWKVDGSVETFAKDSSLTVQAAGAGLQPVSDGAIFAKTGDAIEASYRATGPVMPIFVEYRKLTAPQGSNARIDWGSQQVVDLEFVSLHVEEDGTAGTTPWKLWAACSLNGMLLTEKAFWEDELRVSDGLESPLAWSHRFESYEGDQVTCEVKGSFHDHITSLQALPAGRLGFTVQAGATPGGTLTATGGTAAYSIAWTARIRSGN